MKQNGATAIVLVVQSSSLCCAKNNKQHQKQSSMVTLNTTFALVQLIYLVGGATCMSVTAFIGPWHVDNCLLEVAFSLIHGTASTNKTRGLTAGEDVDASPSTVESYMLHTCLFVAPLVEDPPMGKLDSVPAPVARLQRGWLLKPPWPSVTNAKHHKARATRTWKICPPATFSRSSSRNGPVHLFKQTGSSHTKFNENDESLLYRRTRNVPSDHEKMKPKFKCLCLLHSKKGEHCD